MIKVSIYDNKMIGLLTIVLVLAGCAMGRPHFKRSVDVSKMFESFTLQADSRYYYNGHFESPNAVVAMEKGYTLKSEHWHAANPSSKDLRRWVEKMRNTAGAEYNLDPNGAYILNDQGDRIGVWYSVWVLPKLTFISDKVYSISNPMIVFPTRHRDPEKNDFSPLLH